MYACMMQPTPHRYRKSLFSTAHIHSSWTAHALQQQHHAETHPCCNLLIPWTNLPHNMLQMQQEPDFCQGQQRHTDGPSQTWRLQLQLYPVGYCNDCLCGVSYVSHDCINAKVAGKMPLMQLAHAKHVTSKTSAITVHTKAGTTRLASHHHCRQ